VNEPTFWHSRLFEATILLLIFVNIIMVFVDEAIDIDSLTFTFFMHFLVLLSTVVFTTEYIVQLWACVEDSRYYGNRWSWVCKPLSLLQLVSLIPFFIDLYLIFASDDSYRISNSRDDDYKRNGGNHRHRFKMGMVLQGLRLLRTLSCLRLTHQPLSRVVRVFTNKKAELMVMLSSLMVLIMLSGAIIYILEHDQQPSKFNNLASAMWWSAVTITTLGYGDMVPETTLGRLFASILAMVGIFIFAVPAGVVSSGFVEGALERGKSAATAENTEKSRVFQRKIEQKLDLILDRVMRSQEAQQRRQEEQQVTLQRLCLALERLSDGQSRSSEDAGDPAQAIAREQRPRRAPSASIR
jgi:voltage-gated potassium channel